MCQDRKEKNMEEKLIKALLECFISPRDKDSNLEPANLVDAVNDLAGAFAFAGEEIAGGLREIAAALRERGEV